MQTQDKTYNGWANYATWRVNLEIFDGYEPDAFVTGEQLEEYADELLTMNADENGLAVQYARAFLNGVDWDEIAGHMNEAYGFRNPDDDTAA